MFFFLSKLFFSVFRVPLCACAGGGPVLECAAHVHVCACVCVCMCACVRLCTCIFYDFDEHIDT